MRRRTYLASVAGATALTAGCSGGGGEPFLVVSDFSASGRVVVGERQALRFDAHPTDDEVTDDDPGLLTLSLSNLTRETVTILGGATPPFGVLFAVRAVGSGTATPDETGTRRQFLLWGDYDDCVRVDERGADVSVCEIESSVPIEAGGTVEGEYELRAGSANLEPGRYLVESRVGYEVGDGAVSGVLAYSIRLSLRQRR